MVADVHDGKYEQQNSLKNIEITVQHQNQHAQNEMKHAATTNSKNGLM